MTGGMRRDAALLIRHFDGHQGSALAAQAQQEPGQGAGGQRQADRHHRAAVDHRDGLGAHGVPPVAGVASLPHLPIGLPTRSRPPRRLARDLTMRFLVRLIGPARGDRNPWHDACSIAAASWQS